MEVRERIESPVAPPTAAAPAIADITAEKPPVPLFRTLSSDDLLTVGVPDDWIADVQAATEDAFLALADHLPAEAAEALLEYAATGRLPKPASAVPADPFAHPDALRRFRAVENQDALMAALEAPWDQWAVFLHPAQQGVVDRAYNGPARTSGSAGTGKTVVALHRAVRLAKLAPGNRVLLTTFSQPLASALSRKLRVLVGEASPTLRQVTVLPYRAVADELFQLAFGRRAVVASDEQVSDAIAKSAEAVGAKGFTPRFLASEWRHVVDAWQIADVAAYAKVPRMGRKNRGAGANAGRRPEIVAAPAAASPELSARPVRRTFTAKDKMRILSLTDQAAGTGEIGGILRREGVYSSTLCDWRRQRDAGAYGALTPVRRGPKAAEVNPLAAEVALLQRNSADLARRLARAETIVDVQKKWRRYWG